MIIHCERCEITFIGDKALDPCPFCTFKKAVLETMNGIFSLYNARKFIDMFNEKETRFKFILTADGIKFTR